MSGGSRVIDPVDKIPLELDNVDNTSDLNKPLSLATSAALALKANANNPAFTGTATGLTKGMVGLSDVDNTSDINKPVSTAQSTAISVAVSGITKTSIGLGNVDNTSDINKPISIAQQAAFNAQTAIINTKQDTLSLTTSGSSGPASFSGSTLNIPQYSAAATNIYINIMDYGGNNTGTGDNDTAFNNAWNALGSRGGCIFFPAGQFRFAAGVNKSLPNQRFSVTILGAGDGTTELYWYNSAGGMTFTFNATTLGNTLAFNNMVVEGLTFVTGVANGGYGLYLKIPSGTYDYFPTQTIIRGCSFLGSDLGYSASHYWSQCNRIEGVNQIKWSDCTFQGCIVGGGTGSLGQGVYLGGAGNQYAILFDFTRCLWNWCDYGLLYGPGVQGVTVSQSNFNGEGGTAGIITLSQGGAPNALQAQLFVSDTQFDNGYYAILSQDLVYNIAVTNCTLTISKNNGICISAPNANMLQVTNNSFQTFNSVTGCTGISASGANITISSNTFHNTFNYGVLIGNAYGPVTITGNTFDTCSNTAINISGSGPSTIIGNTFASGSSVGIIINASGNALIVGNFFGVMGYAGYIWQSGTDHCQGMSNSFASGTPNPYINSGSSIAPGTAHP